VSEREEKDWESLLGPDFALHFKELKSQSGSMDFNLLGTYIWSAREAAGKVLGSSNFKFSQVQKTQDGARFSVTGENGTVDIMAFHNSLETDDFYVCAVAAEKLRKAQGSSPNPDSAMNGVFSINLDENKGFYSRWPVTFKDASSNQRELFFSKFFEWQGRVRELAILPMLEKASEIFTSGEYGWVTNSSEVHIIKSARVGDIIETRLASSAPYGRSSSSVDIYYSWYRVSDGGEDELIAQGKMMTTWVKIVGHGVVEVAPFPDEFQAFFSSVSSDNTKPAFAGTAIGDSASEYTAPSGVATGAVLYEHIFETALEDSNLVGNIYFSNYCTWLGRTRDTFLNKVCPELFNTPGGGELFCTRNYIKHLREAMPFDKICVQMRLKSFGKNGIKFYFEFFRYVDGVRGEKIAFAEHEVVWSQSARTGVELGEIPHALKYYMVKSVQTDTAHSIKKAA
jgi:acyl-CoA thioesterase FadM